MGHILGFANMVRLSRYDRSLLCNLCLVAASRLESLKSEHIKRHILGFLARQEKQLVSPAESPPRLSLVDSLERTMGDSP